MIGRFVYVVVYLVVNFYIDVGVAIRGCAGKLAGYGQVDLASKDRMEVAFSNYSVLILYVLYHIIYSDTICHTIFERYAMVRRYFYKGISRWQDNCAMSLMQV